MATNPRPAVKQVKSLKKKDIIFLTALTIGLALGLPLARWQVMCIRGQSSPLCLSLGVDDPRPSIAYAKPVTVTPTPTATASPEQVEQVGTTPTAIWTSTADILLPPLKTPTATATAEVIQERAATAPLTDNSDATIDDDQSDETGLALAQSQATNLVFGLLTSALTTETPSPTPTKAASPTPVPTQTPLLTGDNAFLPTLKSNPTNGVTSTAQLPTATPLQALASTLALAAAKTSTSASVPTESAIITNKPLPTETATPATITVLPPTPTLSPTASLTETTAPQYGLFDLLQPQRGSLMPFSSQAHRFESTQAETLILLFVAPDLPEKERLVEFIVSRDGGSYVGQSSPYHNIASGQGNYALIWKGGEAKTVYYIDVINKTDKVIDYCLVSENVSAWVCE
ncbi:MAG: hypothetical protein AAF629_11365 [Chloroflexota bacterium]